MTTPTPAPQPDVVPIYRGEILDEGYINHVGSTRDAAGNVFWVVTQDLPGADNVDLVVMKRTAGTGETKELCRMTEVKYGKHGYCTAEVVKNHLVLGLSERNAEGRTVFKEYLIVGVAVAWPTG